MRRGIIYIDDNYAEFGEFPNSRDNIRIIYEGNMVWVQTRISKDFRL
jgi:hypothetical protein